MDSTRIKFRVYTRELGWMDDGCLIYPSNSKIDNSYAARSMPGRIQLHNHTLWCPKCHEVWAVIDFGEAASVEGNCTYTVCEKHGGHGLLIPHRVRGMLEIEWPLEVLKRDFLLVMEKKVWEDEAYWPLDVASSYYSDVTLGGKLL